MVSHGQLFYLLQGRTAHISDKCRPASFYLFLGAAVCVALVFEVSNKYMLVIDSILIAIVAVYGLNLLTGFAGLISIGHAAFVGVGAYTLATFARIVGGRPCIADSFLAPDDH